MFARTWRSAVALALLLGSSPLGCQRGKSAQPAAQARPGSPVIEFDERVHDFGIVNQDMFLKHQFVIKNTGNAVLSIQNVRTSCGCTTAAVGLEAIPPGGSSPLEVTLGMRYFSGRGSKTIQIDSNDPRNPTSALEIKYDMQRLIAFRPFFPTLTTRAGRDKVEKVWLEGSLAEQAELRVIKTESGECQVLARPIQERQGGKTRKGLALTLKGDKPGTATGQVTLATGLRNPAEVLVRFRATVEE
ncbi:MAG: DUF1573 domain-containing protein [Polyangiaceae bacterium]|nr:DUF1573 domain-containing protein [Polyangiaceae bacterium]